MSSEECSKLINAWAAIIGVQKIEKHGTLKAGAVAAATTGNRYANPKRYLCANNAPFVTANKHTANDVPCIRMSLMSYVLNARSGRLDPIH